MATAFKMVTKDGVTGATTLYTAPALTTAVVIGLVIANDAGADTTIVVNVVDSSTATTAKLCSSLPLPAASNVQLLDSNTRLVLEAGDSISLTAVAVCDAVISVMEVT
jgi:hypothetical protein